MDLGALQEVVRARSRADLASVGGDTAVVAGATWMMSERQVSVHRLVDLTSLDWPSLEVSDSGLEVAATCTVGELASARFASHWRGFEDLAHRCCDALLASFKVQRIATVGGNICLALPAGAMTSLAASLDARALVWRADGTDYRIAVSDLVIENNRTSLGSGDVVRSIAFEDRVLRARTAFRKVALAPRGRSGAVVIGRVDPDGSFALTVTAAVDRPWTVRADTVPADRDVADLMYSTVPESAWFDDAHGAPDWRRHVCGVLAREICRELT